MSRRPPHLLRVRGAAEDFSALVAAAERTGLRVGWLQLAPDETRGDLPADLAAAADLGVLRAVEVRADRTLTLKPRRGLPVLRDLLREHFRGSALVLFSGPVEMVSLAGMSGKCGLALWLEPVGQGWRLRRSDGPDDLSLQRSTKQLVADLRQPAPWVGLRDQS